MLKRFLLILMFPFFNSISRSHSKCSGFSQSENEVQEVKRQSPKIVDEIDSGKVIAETTEAARPALEEAEAALECEQCIVFPPNTLVAPCFIT